LIDKFIAGVNASIPIKLLMVKLQL